MIIAPQVVLLIANTTEDIPREVKAHSGPHRPRAGFVNINHHFHLTGIFITGVKGEADVIKNAETKDPL